MRKRIALIFVAVGALGSAASASANTGARLVMDAPPPIVLGMHTARSALHRYYRTDYFRIYRCTREGSRKVLCNDGMKIAANGQMAWCNGYDLITDFNYRVRVIAEGCNVTITV